MIRDSQRRAVTLEALLDGKCGAFVRVTDLTRISGLPRQNVQLEIDLRHLQAEQFAERGCWWVTRERAIAWLERHGVSRAEAC